MFDVDTNRRNVFFFFLILMATVNEQTQFPGDSLILCFRRSTEISNLSNINDKSHARARDPAEIQSRTNKIKYEFLRDARFVFSLNEVDVLRTFSSPTNSIEDHFFLAVMLKEPLMEVFSHIRRWRRKKKKKWCEKKSRNSERRAHTFDIQGRSPKHPSHSHSHPFTTIVIHPAKLSHTFGLGDAKNRRKKNI